MLMASNNMQFTVQASATMSVCFIHVRAMELKERRHVVSTASLEQKGQVTFWR